MNYKALFATLGIMGVLVGVFWLLLTNPSVILTLMVSVFYIAVFGVIGKYIYDTLKEIL